MNKTKITRAQVLFIPTPERQKQKRCDVPLASKYNCYHNSASYEVEMHYFYIWGKTGGQYSS